MDVNELIKELELKYPDGWGIQKYLEPDFDGACPCFDSKLKLKEGTLHVRGRCWRVSEYGHQDLHVWGTISKTDLIKVARVIKRLLDKQKWYSKYTIVYSK